jgi:hypothetical protein
MAGKTGWQERGGGRERAERRERRPELLKRFLLRHRIEEA